MSHNLELKEGAIIISDAHYSHLRPELLRLIQQISSKQLKTPQLIFMGDIFDALFGGVDYTFQVNKEIIDLINTISKEIEVIYLEGNHDFNLAKLFPKAKVFSFKVQPVLCSYKDKTVALAHGDFDIGGKYKLYVRLIRNPLLLSILAIIDKIGNHFIIKKLDIYLSKKDDCNKFVNFKEYIQKRSLEIYQSDYFIEGHYHQNNLYKFDSFNYINLAAFACNQRYFIVKSNKESELLEEKKLLKGDFNG